MPDQVKASTIVYLASFAALLGALSMGLALGYSSPAFLSMEKDVNSNVLPKDPAERDAAKGTIGSVLAIGALIGGLLGEPCNKLLGRKLSLVLYGVPFALGWLMIAFANGINLLVWGRFLTGLCCGLVSGTAPSYVVEIAPPKIRGFLGTSFQVMVVIGILLAAIFGTFLNWNQLAGVSVSAAVLMSALMCLMPETPQWLLSKGRDDDAETSLKKLRTSAINSELDEMKQAAHSASSGASQYSIQVLRSREFIVPFMFALALMFFQQFSGINAVLFYQGDIFNSAAPSLNPAVATIVVCVFQVIATIIGSILVDKLGRKALLFASGAGHTISLLVLGIYFQKIASDSAFKENYSVIALISLIVFISAFSIGFGPIPWMMIPELSSTRVRSMVAAIATAFNWLCVYIVTKNFKSLVTAVGSPMSYWIFAIICALSCAFVAFLLLETKGKSNEQIQRELLGEESQELNPSSNNANTLKAMA